MNENLNLVEILKDCPAGTPLYCTIFGPVTFIRIEPYSTHPIVVHQPIKNLTTEVTFTKEGFLYKSASGAECVLFPSQTCRDWSKFKLPQTKEFVEGDHILYNEDGNKFLGVFANYSRGSMCKIIVYSGENSTFLNVNIKKLTKLEKFDPKMLRPGDAVLVRYGNLDKWNFTHFSHLTDLSDERFCACCRVWKQCIPYNQETKLLVGTSEKATEFYNI